MKKYTCSICNTDGYTNGKYRKYCEECSVKVQQAKIKEWHFKHGILNSRGSGSTTGNGQENHMYRNGLCVFRRWAKERLKELNHCCERCGKSIDVSVRGSWAGHHKDHNRSNNVKSNLEVLCKQCHQIEHECWRAFQGVTTIPKGSTQETAEARGTPEMG